jgi:hypothetical protein
MKPYTGPGLEIPQRRGGVILQLSDGSRVVWIYGLMPPNAIVMDPEDDPCLSLPRVRRHTPSEHDWIYGVPHERQ